MSYSENIVIRTRDCDMFGRWKPSAILETMQETGLSHCDALGLGREVTDGLGEVWVLSRCRVEFSRQPRFSEVCAVETYPMPVKHFFFPRAHIFRNDRGEVIGGAQGLWMLMNVETRRAVRDPFVLERMPVEERPLPAGTPATVRPGGAEPVVGAITPGFVEFDLNGHVNNARYMDWCWNALGAEALKDREIASFDVNYDSEVLPGEVMRTELWAEPEGAFTFCGSAGGKRCFGVSVALRSAR